MNDGAITLRDLICNRLDDFQLRMRDVRNGVRIVQETEREADEILAAFREALLSPEVRQDVTNALGRMLRTDGPDPNGYERYKPGDYADAAISTLLDAAGIGTEADDDDA